MMVKDVKIEDIEIRENRFRPIDTDFVKNLAENIIENGLFNPVLVTKDNVLIAGNHRLEAYKLNRELFIPSNIIEFEATEDDQIIMEMSENVIRNDLKKSDKHRLYKELRILRDARKDNGGLNKKSEMGSIEPTSLLSTKEVERKSELLRRADAKEVGFTSGSEQKRVSAVIASGIDEVIDAMDQDLITPTAANNISKMDKEDQKQALDNKLKGVEVKGKKGAHEEKMIQMKKQDKFGAYTQIKCYISDPVQTAKTISKQYGEAFIDAYQSLVVEMHKELARMKHKGHIKIDPDKYSIYSNGLKNVSDGDFLEICELLSEGIVSNTTIENEYSIGSATLRKIINLKKEQQKGSGQWKLK